MGCVVSCLLLWPGIGRAEGFYLESVGVRGGISANHSSRYFHEADAFANFNLPWGWELGKEWSLQTRLDVSAGWVGDGGGDAAILTAGPSVVLGRKRLPVSLEGGVSPTFLSRHEFGSKNLGMNFQITSHVALNWDFARHWRVSASFQHMSNAGLASKNPGLNLYLFALSYRF
jgi:hypothetical protein